MLSLAHTANLSTVGSRLASFKRVDNLVPHLSGGRLANGDAGGQSPLKKILNSKCEILNRIQMLLGFRELKNVAKRSRFIFYIRLLTKWFESCKRLTDNSLCRQPNKGGGVICLMREKV